MPYIVGNKKTFFYNSNLSFKFKYLNFFLILKLTTTLIVGNIG